MTAPLDDAEDRAIARALDADDAASLVTGVGSADDDMSATDEYREALSYLPFAEVEPAPELEDRVVAAALARRPADVPALERVARRRSIARRVTTGRRGSRGRGGDFAHGRHGRPTRARAPGSNRRDRRQRDQYRRRAGHKDCDADCSR